jgi:peroxiredoxin
MSTTTEQPIATKVAELQATVADKLPPAALAAFSAEQRDLNARGVPAGVATPGTPMPDGDLLDVHGAATSLAAQRAGGPAVVVFYRGAWCPYCNLALRTYESDVVPTLTESGVTLIAVNPQQPDGSLSMAQANELTFAVVSDPGNRVADALGIRTTPSADTRAAQALLGVDVASGNADGTADLPMPTAVLVDADGVIRWIDVHPDYTTRTEPAQILDAVRTLLGK